MVTAAGSGYSHWRDLAVTRWREDATRDCWGTYLYLRDGRAGTCGRPGISQCALRPVHYEAEFTEDRVRILRADAGIESSMEIMVAADDDVEIRRVTLKNTGSRPREIEITSYAEIVLATPASDEAHPAFSNLFVQTEYVAQVNGLFATRRPRSASDESLWAAHVVAYDSKNESGSGIEFETDRAKFLGRGRTVQSPLALLEGRRLSNTVGAVLDPVASLRVHVAIAPGATVHASFATMTAASRELSSTWPTSTTILAHLTAHRRWRGPMRRSSCTTWASPGARPRSSSNWPAESCTRTRCFELRVIFFRVTGSPFPNSGSSGFRVTARFCLLASKTARTSVSSVNC